jgi:lysophospholipase L1-like esterase
MGGENAMHKWVTANPPLAYKDYTHLNTDGAKTVADMLSEVILNTYRQNQ